MLRECTNCGKAMDTTDLDDTVFCDEHCEDEYYDGIAEEEGGYDAFFGPDYDYGDGPDFQDPGGRSALRRSTSDNPRIHPCPACGRPNALTPADVQLGYQCDRCADQAEGLLPNAYY